MMQTFVRLLSQQAKVNWEKKKMPGWPGSSIISYLKEKVNLITTMLNNHIVEIYSKVLYKFIRFYIIFLTKSRRSRFLSSNLNMSFYLFK